MRDMLYRIEEIADDIYAISDDITADPTEALNAIESRLDKISKLKRKYGLTIASILEYRDKVFWNKRKYIPKYLVVHF